LRRGKKKKGRKPKGQKKERDMVYVVKQKKTRKKRPKTEREPEEGGQKIEGLGPLDKRCVMTEKNPTQHSYGKEE